MKQFITLLMLLVFTVSFAMPKDNLNIQKDINHEKVFTAAIDNPVIAIDIEFMQLAKVDRTDVQYQNNRKGYNLYNLSESRFFSGVTKSGFNYDYDSYKQPYKYRYNSKIEALYIKNFKERSTYNGSMYLRRIQRNDSVTKGSNYPASGNYYFKRKFGNLSSIKNTKLGNAINMDWRCLHIANCSQITSV